jgi:hypothetical protein
MKIARYGRSVAMAVLATLVLSGTGWATVIPIIVGPFTFCPPSQYADNFVEVRRGSEISPGPDPGTGHCAVNFTGSAGSAGDTWLTRSNAGSFNAFNGTCMQADILINKFNNAKGGGLVALLQTDPGGKGLFLLLIDSGNTDRLTLNTIDPNSGKIVQLPAATVPLGSGIVENAWYRLNLVLTARGVDDSLSVGATVRSHTDPSNPDSDVDGQIGSTLEFNGSLNNVGLEQDGFVGMAAWAKSAVVNTSMTNFFAASPCFD